MAGGRGGAGRRKRPADAWLSTMAAATASSALKRLDLRDPNALFETHGAEEIRGLERQVRAEIEHKKEELRQMVGERYRDLIEAADTIGQMRRCAEGLVDAVQATDQYCARLRQAGSAAPRVPRAPQVSPGPEPATSRRRPASRRTPSLTFRRRGPPLTPLCARGGVCRPSVGRWSAAEKSAGLLLQEPSRTSGRFPRLPWVPCAPLPLKTPGVSRQSRTDLSVRSHLPVKVIHSSSHPALGPGELGEGSLSRQALPLLIGEQFHFRQRSLV